MSNPHPNLLVPELITRTRQGELAEIYPFCHSPTLHDIRQEDKLRELNFTDADIARIAFGLLLAAEHMYRLGFIHCDIRPINIFITLTLNPTDSPAAVLFDYDNIKRPGVYPRPVFEYSDMWDRSDPIIGDYIHPIPPEARRNKYVHADEQEVFELDERFMVYQIGACLMQLTHFQHLIYLKPFPGLNPDLLEVIKKAIGPKDDRFITIQEMKEALDQFL